MYGISSMGETFLSTFDANPLIIHGVFRGVALPRLMSGSLTYRIRRPQVMHFMVNFVQILNFSDRLILSIIGPDRMTDEWTE